MAAFSSEHIVQLQQLIGMNTKSIFDAMAANQQTNPFGGQQGHGGGTHRNLVDALSKRLEIFKNSGFESWQFKLMTATSSQSQKAFMVLEKGKENLDSPVADDWVQGDKPLEDANREMYAVLTEKTDGEAFDIVRGVPLQNGAEAWRRLLVRFDARTIGKEMLLARRVVNPPKIKNLRETAAQLERWEEQVRKLKTQYSCDIPSGLQKAIVIEMLPASVMEGVMARLDKSNQDFHEVKAMILNYVETRMDFGGSMPMQVDHLEWVDEWHDQDISSAPAAGDQEHCDLNAMYGKGKAKGKGKYPFPGLCNHCGEWGHKAAACPKRIECWTCGGAGHRSSECPQKGKAKGKGSERGLATYWGSWSKGDKGNGKGYWNGKSNTGKGNGKNTMGKGPAYAIYEGADWSGSPPPQGWSGSPPSQGEETLALFGLSAGQPRAGEPMKIDLEDFIKPKRTARPARQVRQEDVRHTKAKNSFHILEGDELEQDCPEVPVPHAPPVSAPRGPRTMRAHVSMAYRKGAEKESEHQDCSCCTPLCFLESDASKESSTKSSSLHGLFNADVELNNVSMPQWRTVPMVMDSGAAESVAPLDMAPWVSMMESPGSRRGQTYVSASGEKLPNLGQKTLDAVTEEGRGAKATFQVADVTRALCSISRVCDQGNRVIFESGGGWIEASDGRRTAFKRENNVYVMELYVHDPGMGAGGGEVGDHQSGFTRPSH